MRNALRSLPTWLVLVLLAAALPFACSTTTKQLGGELSAENETVRLILLKVRYKDKGGNLRVWATLENKLDQTIEVGYGGFRLEAAGKTYAGALRVPFARTTKDFEMTPLMVKRLPGPIEFLDVPRVGEATLVLNGAGGAPVSVTFPVLGDE